MARFEVFIGTWNTTGEILETAGSAPGVLVATDSYRWLPGRHFILHEADARLGDQVARSVEVMGYDTEQRIYAARSYDDQGVSEHYRVWLTGRAWRIDGKATRCKGRFDSGGNRLTGLWELKSRRGIWEPWIRLALDRA